MIEKKQEQTFVPDMTEFRREIGVFGGVSLLGGIMIGSGIFYIGSFVLMRAGMNIGLALICWIFGGLVSLLGGLCIAELGTSIPRAGGVTVYMSEAIHPIVGFLSGFNSLWIGGSASIAGCAIALPTALRALTPLSDDMIKAIAVALIVALTIFNYFGIKMGSWIQNIAMIAKMIPILIVLIAALLFGRVKPDLTLALPENVHSFPQIVGMLAFTVMATLWAYEGWVNLNNVTEEMKNPGKNLPRAILIAILGIMALYTLFNYAIYRVLPFDSISAYLQEGNYYLGTEAAKATLGPVGAVIVTIGMVVAVFGALNGCIIAMPRITYAIAKDGHFFAPFGKLHPKYQVPYFSLIVQGALSIVFVLFRSLSQLMSLVVFTSYIYYFLTVIAVFRMRAKYPNLERPFKVWGYPYTVILTAMIFMGLVINTLVEDTANSLIGVGVSAFGVLVYFGFQWWNKRRQSVR